MEALKGKTLIPLHRVFFVKELVGNICGTNKKTITDGDGKDSGAPFELFDVDLGDAVLVRRKGFPSELIYGNGLIKSVLKEAAEEQERYEKAQARKDETPSPAMAKALNKVRRSKTTTED